MRRLLLASALLASVPAAPAMAGPGVCVVVNSIDACNGACVGGEPITVIGISASGAEDARAYCGGESLRCTTFRAACTDTAVARYASGLECHGDADIVICIVGLAAAN